MNTFNVGDFLFYVSDSAQTQLKKILVNENDKLRISVESGGCSGFQYAYQIVQAIQKDDFVKILDNEITILIDETSRQFLYSATLDYVNNLTGAFFKINNPNSKMNCGCGNSFDV